MSDSAEAVLGRVENQPRSALEIRGKLQERGRKSATLQFGKNDVSEKLDFGEHLRKLAGPATEVELQLPTRVIGDQGAESIPEVTTNGEESAACDAAQLPFPQNPSAASSFVLTLSNEIASFQRDADSTPYGASPASTSTSGIIATHQELTPSPASSLLPTLPFESKRPEGEARFVPSVAPLASDHESAGISTEAPMARNAPPIEIIRSQTHFSTLQATQFMSSRSQATISALQVAEVGLETADLEHSLHTGGTPARSNESLDRHANPVGAVEVVPSASGPSLVGFQRESSGDEFAHGAHHDKGLFTFQKKSDDATDIKPATGGILESHNLPIGASAQPSIGNQVGSRLEQAVREIARATPGAPRVPTPVLRTIDLMLEPQSLGPMVLKLRGHGSILDVEVLTASAEAAKVLSEDRGDLDTRLKVAGIELSSLSVSIIPDVARTHGMPAHQQGVGTSEQQFVGGGSTSQGSSFSNAFGGAPRGREDSQTSAEPRQAQQAQKPSMYSSTQSGLRRSLYV